MAACWPDGGGRLRKHRAQPVLVLGLEVVAGHNEVRHAGGSHCSKRRRGEAGEVAGGPVEEFAPVCEDKVLPRLATGPQELLCRLGQGLDVHARGEHLPDGGEGGPAELAGEGLHKPGEGGYLQWLVHVDDAAGRVPGGVGCGDNRGDGVPDDGR